MTPEEFAVKCDKSLPTVMNWIAKGYVPGADMNYIPDSAREPYTAARAKNGIARIKSILKACCDGKGVVPALFGM